MKRVFSILLIFVLLFIFTCCGSKQGPDNEQPELLSAHWDMVLQNNDYLIGEHDVILGMTEQVDIPSGVDVKYNLKTHVVSPICVDELCSHEEGSSCKFQDVVSYCFVKDNDVFYRVNVHTVIGTYEEKDENGNSSEVPLWDQKQEFVRYNLLTGDYKVLISMSSTEAEMTGGRFIRSGNNAFYLRYIPQVEKPQSESDYKLYLCSTDLKDGGETRVFEAPSVLGKKSVLLFCMNQAFYFYDSQTQQLFRVTNDGTVQADMLLNGTGEQTVQGGVDGLFSYGSYFYYPVEVGKADPAHGELSGYYLYRLNVETKQFERVSNEIIERFNATEKGLVCILHSNQLPEYGHEGEPAPGADKNLVVRFGYDGSTREYLGFYNPSVLGEPFMTWVAGDDLFLWCTMSTYRFSLTNGQIYTIVSDEIVSQS